MSEHVWGFLAGIIVCGAAVYAYAERAHHRMIVRMRERDRLVRERRW